MAGGLVARPTDADFLAWVQAQREPLRRTAFLICGDWYLADDLVQEATARVYAKWPRLASRGEPNAYARKIVINLVNDYGRRPARREISHEYIPEPFVRAAPDGSADDSVQARVLSALGDLPPGQRAVLVLRFWDDQSLEQTAAILGISVGTVKSQSSRGLTSLRTSLADLELESPLTIGTDLP
jgi:RNA polymerase sigma-70 factor (sigma-E family)